MHFVHKIWHMRTTKKKPTTDPKGRCGSRAGYAAHGRRGESACAACKAANNKRERQRAVTANRKPTGTGTAGHAVKSSPVLQAVPIPAGETAGATAAPAHLKARGTALWESVTTGYRLSPAALEVLGETCRIADRLERFAGALASGSTMWFELEEPDDLPDGVNIVVNGMIGEARQLTGVLRQNLERLGLVEVEQLTPADTQKESLMDELARKRRERLEREGIGS